MRFFTYFGLGIVILAADTALCMFYAWIFGNDFDDDLPIIGWIFNALAFSGMLTIHLMEKM